MQPYLFDPDLVSARHQDLLDSVHGRRSTRTDTPRPDRRRIWRRRPNR